MGHGGIGDDQAGFDGEILGVSSGVRSSGAGGNAAIMASARVAPRMIRKTSLTGSTLTPLSPEALAASVTTVATSVPGEREIAGGRSFILG